MNATACPRSWLFVPGDSEKKIAKIDGCGADAIILDFEDAVAPDRKDAARSIAADYLASCGPGDRPAKVWVRVNPFDTGLTQDDLAAVLSARPDGIVQPKIEGPADVSRLSEMIARIGGGTLPIMPIATETPRAVLALSGFADADLPDLFAMTWGAEDLSAELGASTNLDASGAFAEVYRVARSMMLLAAHAAGVPAIDTLHADFRDLDGLLASSRAARAEGFSGRLAIHPAQVAPINEGFTPSPEEIERAKRISDAFAAEPGVGTVGLDGRMIDRPHLRAAEKTLAQARALGL